MNTRGVLGAMLDGSQAGTRAEKCLVGPLKGHSNPRIVLWNPFEARKEAGSAVKHGLATALMRPAIPIRFWDDYVANSVLRVELPLRRASIAQAVGFFAG